MLEWSNARIITSNSAVRLEELAEELNQQAKVIQQKDEAYRRLEQTYNDYKENRKGELELDKAIKSIDDLPETQNTSIIQHELQEIELDLLNISDS